MIESDRFEGKGAFVDLDVGLVSISTSMKTPLTSSMLVLVLATITPRSIDADMKLKLLLSSPALL